jgi:hypothetical protein
MEQSTNLYWSGKEWLPDKKSQKKDDELTEEEIHRNNRIVAQKLADASKLADIQHWATTSGGYIEDILTESEWRNV